MTSRPRRAGRCRRPSAWSPASPWRSSRRRNARGTTRTRPSRAKESTRRLLLPERINCSRKLPIKQAHPVTLQSSIRSPDSEKKPSRNIFRKLETVCLAPPKTLSVRMPLAFRGKSHVIAILRFQNLVIANRSMQPASVERKLDSFGEPLRPVARYRAVSSNPDPVQLRPAFRLFVFPK